ncbi:MAG: hypothetical protein RLY31_147 [Bacteroidota bacterium]
MKVQVSVLLLVVLVALPPAVAWLSFHNQRVQVRRSIKRQMVGLLDREDLVRLSFRKDQVATLLEWEHPREFSYRGQFYDVVFRAESADSMTYWCWWDHAETALNRQLSALLSHAMGKDPQQRAHQQRWLDFRWSLFCRSLPDPADLIFLLVNARFSYRALAGNSFRTPSVPPPRTGSARFFR